MDYLAGKRLTRFDGIIKHMDEEVTTHFQTEPDRLEPHGTAIARPIGYSSGYFCNLISFGRALNDEQRQDLERELTQMMAEYPGEIPQKEMDALKARMLKRWGIL